MAGGIPNRSEIERLRVELEALRESAEKHRLLIETTDTGYVILDDSGLVQDANAVYVRMTGHERLDQIIGHSVTEWTASYDLERNAVEVRRCLEGSVVRNLEIDYIGPGGKTTPVEINATVRNGPAGVTILTVCRDISNRRRAEKELRSSERRYRATIDFLGEAIHVVDPDLRIELLNKTGELWMRGLGITNEIVGQNIFEVFPFLPGSVRDEYRRVFAGEGPLITEEVSMVSGQEVATETRKIPIVDGGRVTRVITVIRDVTESMRARDRLHQTEKMEALGQLAGGIAHDFNNQLAAVLGYAELLSRGAEGHLVREYASEIARVAKRSAELTRQLLTFARKGRARSVPLDVHALLGEVTALLGRIIDPRITVHTQLDAPRAVTIGDPSQLHSAFLNLALNARDAMPEGGMLTFTTDIVPAGGEVMDDVPEWSLDGAHLRVRVSDTGMGMSDEVRRRIFEPFFTTKAPGQGTGMGLAAVYGTIANHHGAIEVESEPGRGSTFTVLLWLADDRLSRDSEAPVEEPLRGNGHILVVDDDPAVLHSTARSLAALGYRVTERSDGSDAVSCYRESASEIDLVLLDVMMPGLDGIAVLAELRRINPNARVILYSGHPLGREEQRLIDQGAAAFLEKPFSLSDLSRLVASLMSG